jgi:hypothetical protein
MPIVVESVSINKYYLTFWKSIILKFLFINIKKTKGNNPFVFR